jgi:hypothetical protein
MRRRNSSPPKVGSPFNLRSDDAIVKSGEDKAKELQAKFGTRRKSLSNVQELVAGSIGGSNSPRPAAQSTSSSPVDARITLPVDARQASPMMYSPVPSLERLPDTGKKPMLGRRRSVSNILATTGGIAPQVTGYSSPRRNSAGDALGKKARWKDQIRVSSDDIF